MKIYVKSSIQFLSDLSTEDRYDLANDFTTPPEILKELADTDPSESVRFAAHTNLTLLDMVTVDYRPEFLSSLYDSSVPTIRWIVARHPNTPIRVLKMIIDNDDDYRIREAAKKSLSERNI